MIKLFLLSSTFVYFLAFSHTDTLKKPVENFTKKQAKTIQNDQVKLPFTPTSSYAKHQIHGFTLLVNPELGKHPNALKDALAEMTRQLTHINQSVEKNILKELKKVQIWMEWQVKKHGAACCHWSEKWLKNNGYNPEKKGAVEINNAVNFVKWSQAAQPCMVLHELAHAYHQVIMKKFGNSIRDSYKNAVKMGTYEKVKHVNGREKRAYAMNNDKEYFAELTEAYLGKNDFYPFNRSDLKKHDPKGYALLQKIWTEQ